MPRAKPYHDWIEAWISEPLKLRRDPETREAIQMLIEAAGVASGTPEAKTVCRQVQAVLEQWPGAERVLDHAPRPANQLAALQDIEEGLHRFRQALQLLDSRTRDSLDDVCHRREIDLLHLERQFGALADCVTVVQHAIEAENTESRGAAPMAARRLIVSLLSRVYDETVPPTSRDRETLETFIRAACRLGEIDLPENLEAVFK